MPPKLKLPKRKPCFAPSPIPQTQGPPLTRALAFHSNGDDNDGDFQRPTSVILPSSLRKTPSSHSQPSKPHNGERRPEKKPKFVSSCERESRPINQTEGIGSRVSSPVLGNVDFNSRSSFDEKEETLSPSGQKCVVAETVDLSSTVCWPLLEIPVAETSLISSLSPGFDENGGNLLDSSFIESQIVENSNKTKADFTNLKENFDLASVEPNLLDSSIISSNDKFNPPLIEESNKPKLSEKKSPKENCKSDANHKGKYHLKSIESKLVESGSKSEIYESETDFEQATQLNDLMNCLERDIEFKRGNNEEAYLLEENNGLVECPLCGVDLSDFSEELRQVHTNDCLDNCEDSEAPDSMRDTKSNLPKENSDTSSVIEWLRNLGLWKYEEIFIREEIDWDTLQCLTEEDLLNIGITTLGSRKKIMNALREFQNNKNYDNTTNSIQNSTTNTINYKETNKPTSGNKLITEYFIGPKSKSNVDVSTKKPVKNDVLTNGVFKRNSKKKGDKKRVRDVPTWCCVPGTPFRVDAFRYLEGSCSHWFLTHFHMDHYQGLTKKFCHGKIYCSEITARLINLKIGVPMEKIYILALNQKINIAGVNIFCFDANHCPGSIILLFEPPNGKAVLHTGDFRFSSDMKNNSVLQLFRIHTLILDTTYCNPQYDFPKQEAVIQFVIEAIQAEAFNPKTLFLIGSYTIGKERLFLEVARVLRKKIYVNSAKLNILRCLELPQEQMQWLTANEAESNIHVVPMWTLASFKRMKYVSDQYAGRYDLIVAFSPTGWSFGKGTKRANGKRLQQGTIIRYEVPYSEHSSFTELREFVRFISAENIIPSVNNDGPHSADNMLSLLLSDL